MHEDLEKFLESQIKLANFELDGDNTVIKFEKLTLTISNSELPEWVEDWRDSPKCDCCGISERRKNDGLSHYLRERHRKMLFGETWCADCHHRTKAGPKLRKKSCKIAALHNRNHKKYIAGELVGGYNFGWRITWTDGTIETNEFT